MALGKTFGVPRSQTHGCDVRDMAAGQDEDEERGFCFTLLRGAQCRGGYLPYPAESFSLITMIMTLHHLEDQEEAVWEVSPHRRHTCHHLPARSHRSLSLSHVAEAPAPTPL